MTLTGINTVAKQEFRVRLRTGRWRWLLIAWVAVIAAFTVMLRLGLHTVRTDGPTGIPMFGGLMLFVLGLALLVSPGLTAQSINGDRERGTLATVQVTRLSAAELAVGKLLAAWGTALVFVALTVPFVVWSLLEGGVAIGRAVAVLAIVALMVGVICAVAQALSALFARGITSTLMSYLVVFALTVGTVVVFGLAMTLTIHAEQRTYEYASSPDGRSTPHTYTSRTPHPEYVWWLLAPNPFVVLADSAPAPAMKLNPYLKKWEPATDLDPLSAMALSIRQMRTPYEPGSHDYGNYQDQARNAPAVWPYGLGFDLLLGAGSVWISARRLRTPVKGLTRGVRIA